MRYDREFAEGLIIANTNYDGFGFDSPVNEEIVSKIERRHVKDEDEQKGRTQDYAEVYTPSEIVREMVDQLGLEELEWDERVARDCMEITCGEAPFIVNRYDAGTGEEIPISKRCGILDVKLRTILDKCPMDEKWKQIQIAYQHTYGYEYQGDSLYIARTNLLDTFIDYYRIMFGTDPEQEKIDTIKGIIVTNFVQMDGLTFTKPGTEKEYVSVYDYVENREVELRSILAPKDSSTIETGYSAMDGVPENNFSKCKEKDEPEPEQSKRIEVSLF